MRIGYKRSRERFLLTRLLRGVTIGVAKLTVYHWISTHTPLARRDPQGLSCVPHKRAFLLTRLLRGVTRRSIQLLCPFKFLLTRLLRGVTRCRNVCVLQKLFLLTRLLRGVTLRAV